MRIWIALLAVMAGCGGGDSGGTSGAATGDPRIVVDVYDASKAYNGTTFFATNYDNTPRIIRVDMTGNVVWEYVLPDYMLAAGQIAVDAEYLPDSNSVLIVASRVGVFEVDYEDPSILKFSFLTAEISHDADRLANGNTLFVYGHDDVEGVNTQVTEVDSLGNVVWSWRAWEHAEFDSFSGTFNGGWVHANAVQRLPNGNTLISLRNFQMTVTVDHTPAGNVVEIFDWDAAGYGVCYPHEPEFIPGTPPHVLVALQNESSFQAVEIEWPSGTVVWTYAWDGPLSSFMPTRDADRLPNGNTLLQSLVTIDGVKDSVIVEVTPSGEIVWQMRLVGYAENGTPGFIYKAQRVGS
ncbi:MAG: aryl-sulfate sulfotransferase [Planctomycetes bacterium]|nr:aryl-sulfate sulfotransferase [Planctomycetota bacterium]